MKQNVCAVLLAAGYGARIGSRTPKQFLTLGKRTILEHAIKPFEDNTDIKEIIVVVSKDYLDWAEIIVSEAHFEKVRLVTGGSTRHESSLAGIDAIKHEDCKLLIHDVARPLLPAKTLSKIITALDTHEAVIIGMPISDTLLRSTVENSFDDVVDKSNLSTGQTPFGCHLKTLREAYAKEKDLNQDYVTSQILKRNIPDISIAMLEGSPYLFKITHAVDVEIARALVERFNLHQD